MVEGGDQADVRRQEHAVAEDVAGHVADPGHRERCRLDVDVHLAEVAGDGFPCAAGGDAHLLVVVARRTARCECIVQPEAGFLRQSIGRVGEGCRALVGGHDEIGIVAIDAQCLFGSHHVVTDDVVGDGEKRADEGLVGLSTRGEDLVA